MFFDFDLKKIIRWLLSAALPLLAIKAQDSPPHEEWFDKPFSYLVTLVQKPSFAALSSTRDIVETYLQIINTNERNKMLMQINDELNAKAAVLEDLRKENDSLRALLELKNRSPMELLAAESISSTSDLSNNTFWINKGAKHKVKIGQAVLSSNTIVGSIIRVFDGRAQVLMVTDRFSVLDGLIARTRAKGIIEGLGNNQAVFKSFEKLTDLNIGDEIVSTGIDQAFPKGVRVAKVKKLDVDQETGLPKAILEVNFNSAQLERVFVVISGSDVDHGFWSGETR
jgi:rod shape-determining protein MreC